MTSELSQPLLPVGKQYHVMFSFQSEDRVWVRRMLETLEAPPYNLKCCIADRDFHPGREVMQNIEVCMHESLNIVLVMSPEHLESHYCDFETNLAMELHHEKKGKVIPVLRRGENVPGSLRFINYIDARDGVNECEVTEKLAKAISEAFDNRSNSSTYNLMVSDFGNGEEICIDASRKICSIWFTPSTIEIPMTTIRDCNDLGMEVTQSYGLKVMLLANDCTFLRYHWWIHSRIGRFVLWLISTVMASTATSFYSGLASSTSLPHDSAVLSLICGLLAMGGSTVILFPLILTFWRLWARKRRASFSGLISQRTYKRKLMVAIGDERNNPVIRLIRYDVINCQEYIRENMLTELDENHTSQNEMTRMILEAGIAKYIKVLIDSYPVAPRSRHRVRRDVVCLCQFIEVEQIHLAVGRKLIQRELGINGMANNMRRGARSMPAEDGELLI